MPASNPVHDLISGLIACDEQPTDERLTELRKTLQQKAIKMNRKGRISQYIFVAGMLAMALGFAVILVAVEGHQRDTWLSWAGFSVFLGGALIVVVGAIGLLCFRGFGYACARHDLIDAEIMELSVQVQRLSQKVDEMDKTNVPAT